MVAIESPGGAVSVATSIPGPAEPRGPPSPQRPHTVPTLTPHCPHADPTVSPYQHAGAEQEAVDGLGDIGGVRLVVVGVAVLPIADLQRVQQRGEEHGGDLGGHTRVSHSCKRESHPGEVPGDGVGAP